MNHNYKGSWWQNNDKYILPKTRLGKWSVGLMIVFFIVIFVQDRMVAWQGSVLDQTFLGNPALSLAGLSAFLAAMVAFITGIISIFKHKERSVFVYLAILIGLMVLIFVFGEIVVPH